MRKQYIKVRPGIRQHMGSRRYQAYKRINEKQYTKTFKLISEAKMWLQREWRLKPKVLAMDLTLDHYLQRYINEYMSTLEKSTQEKNIAVIVTFLKPVKDKVLSSINRTEINALINYQKSIASSKRFSFRNELKVTNAFFNWTNLRVEEFKNPITKDHHKLGQIKKPKVRDNKVPARKVFEFLSNLEGIYQDLAYFQFFTASRISEACGIQIQSINFKEKMCIIAHTVSWDRSKKFIELKDYTKNKETRICYLPDEVLKRLRSRIRNRSSGYIFTTNGGAMKYRSIQNEYTKALKKSGISNVSVTHFLRHSSANIVRESSNSLDLAQAMTGHKDRSVVEKTYTKSSSGTQKLALQHLVDSMHKVMEK